MLKNGSKIFPPIWEVEGWVELEAANPESVRSGGMPQPKFLQES